MLLSRQRASLQTLQHCSSGPMASPVQYRVRAQCLSHTSAGAPAQLQHGDELDDSFTGLDAGTGLMTVAGFGSLLSGEAAVRLLLLYSSSPGVRDPLRVISHPVLPARCHHLAHVALIRACRTQRAHHLSQPAELQAWAGE